MKITFIAFLWKFYIAVVSKKYIDTKQSNKRNNQNSKYKPKNYHFTYRTTSSRIWLYTTTNPQNTLPGIDY